MALEADPRPIDASTTRTVVLPQGESETETITEETFEEASAVPSTDPQLPLMQ